MSMNSLSRRLDALVERIEGASVLDKPADLLSQAVRRLLPEGPVRDLASGTPAAHPVHPALVSVPIGAWLGASVLDLTPTKGTTHAARTLIGVGLLTAAPTALTGANDWLDTAGAERRVGFAHASLNWVALGLYGASWLRRGRGRHASGAALALAGAGVLTASGWLGGHLTYAVGVGVDTTAFQQYPGDWTDVAADEDLQVGVPVRVSAEGTPVLLLRTAAGLTALADRCTHRGAPLDEGTVVGDCIQCPWHGSRFDVHDGSVRRGPASRPQPVLSVRSVAGRVQVRRTGERRSMRTDPVGI
jgi:nitrite reductase/ring-hydroxylating ferredoxin subunit/uncharacterized membrane protein